MCKEKGIGSRCLPTLVKAGIGAANDWVNLITFVNFPQALTFQESESAEPVASQTEKGGVGILALS